MRERLHYGVSVLLAKTLRTRAGKQLIFVLSEGPDHFLLLIAFGSSHLAGRKRERTADHCSTSFLCVLLHRLRLLQHGKFGLLLKVDWTKLLW
jgi:hypothetical protein